MDREHFWDELAGDIQVERSIGLPAHPDKVWEHVTDGSLLGEWMGDEVHIEPRTGGTITMTPEAGPRVWGTVEEVVEGRRIQWSWRSDEGMPTLVEIELVPGKDGTDLTVTETLLSWQVGGASPRWVGPPGPRASLTAVA